MIVISGALVAVALLLLVVGLTVTTLNLIYASIAVSGLSLAFLLVGIYQRRGELPVADGPAVPAEEPSYPSLSPLPARPSIEPRRTVAGVPPARPVVADLVLIVVGRPRYHVEGCRYLVGKTAEEVTVEVALSEGFTGCVVCKPADGSGRGPAQAPTGDAQDLPFDLDAVVPLAADRAGAVPQPRVPAVRRAPVLGRVPAQPVAAEPVPAVRTPAVRAAAQPAVAAVLAPAQRPAKRAARAPVLPVSPAPVSPAPVDLDRVVVIADRTKFHVAGCRFVRLAADTSLITRQAAQDQGYLGCGVCKP